MESNIYKGNKNDFLYFVNMALQKRMPWNILASLFKNLAPTLNETRNIIDILLKELETLQSILHKKENLLKKHQKYSSNCVKNEVNGVQDNSNCLQESEEPKNEFETLEVVDEPNIEEKYFELFEESEVQSQLDFYL